jgi:hypothetical protein
MNNAAADSPERAPTVQALRARPGAGFAVADIAKRFRVGEDRVRGWIKRGEMIALNTSDTRCGRPRYVVTPEALAEFERGRSAAQPKPARPRRRRPHIIDYYAD